MKKDDLICCRLKKLPKSLLVEAARTATLVNPVNHPRLDQLAGLMRGFRPSPRRIAVMTTSYWGAAGVKLTVAFLDNPPAALRKRILLHMNAWDKDANIQFVAGNVDPKVRISRVGGKDGGYWSYVGTEILHIPKGKATMNLEEFTMETLDSEFYRVVRHETGHTLGFPHEHMRRALVDKIDRKKAIAYFKREDNWDERETIDQVLTPIEEAAIRGTIADPKSIMCYQIPGEITKNGKPIVGGLDIDESDYRFAGQLYPKQAPKQAPKKAAPPAKRRGAKKTA
jgi:hypothetical protein